MAEYKGLNIVFRGDASEASAALSQLSAEAKSAQGNLQAVQQALDNASTNGKDLNSALRSLQLQETGNAARAAADKVDAYRQALEGLNGKLQDAQQKLVTNRDALQSMPQKYDALAASAKASFEAVAQAMDELSGAKADMSGLSEGSDAYVEAQARVEQAQAKVNAAVAAGDEAFAKLAAEYGTLEGGMNAATETIQATGAEIERTTQKMLVQESQARALAAEHQALSTAMSAGQTALAQAGESMGAWGTNLTTIGDSLTSVADKMTLVSTIAAATFGRKVISSTEDFGNAIAQLGGYLDISGAQLEDMGELALQFGKDTQFSATEAANAMNELAKGGMTQAQIAGGAMEATMQLAAAGSLDMASAAETAVQAIKVFGMQSEDATAVADALAGAANKSTAEVSDLAAGFSQIGSAAGMAGWDLNEVVGALALLADRGFSGAEAGTTLKTTLQRLASPTDKARETMEALGISVYDSQGKMVDALDIIGQFQSAMEGLTDERRNEALLDIFGMRGINGMTALLSEGAEGFREYVSATEEAGYALEMAQSRMGDLGWALEYLRGEAETAVVSFGQALTPTIVAAAEAIEGALAWFNGLDEGMQSNIASMALFVAAAGPVTSIVGHMVSGFGGLLKAAGDGAVGVSTFATAMRETGSAAQAMDAAYVAAMSNGVSANEAMAVSTVSLSTVLKTALVGAGILAVVAAVGSLVGAYMEWADYQKDVTDATDGLADAMGRADAAMASHGDSARDAASSLAELRDATRDVISEQAELARAMGDDWEQLGTDAAVLESYVDELASFAKQGSLTEAQAQNLANAVEQFNSTTGASLSVIDSQRGKLSLTEAEIREVAAAYQQQERAAQAAADKGRLLEEQARIEAQLAQNAERGASATAQYDAQMGALVGTLANAPSAVSGVTGEFQDLEAAYAANQREIANLEAEIGRTPYAFSTLEAAMVAAGITGAQYESLTEAQLAQLRAAFDGTIASIAAKLGSFGVALGGLGQKGVKDLASKIGSGFATDVAPAVGGGVDQAGQAARKAQQEANDEIYDAQKKAYDDERKALQKALDAEYDALKKAYDKEYKALQKQLDREYKAQQKAYDAEYKEMQKALDAEYEAQQKAQEKAYDELNAQLDAEYEARKKAYEAEHDALKKRLDKEYDALKDALSDQLSAYKKGLDAQYKAQKDANSKRLAEAKSSDSAEEAALKKALDARYDERKKASDKELKAQQKADQKALKEAKAAYDAQTKAFKAATDARIAAIKAEGDERKRALEAADGTSAIDSRIKELQDETKAERDAIRQREREQKTAELRKAVEQAKTRRTRADAEKALSDYLAELAQEDREAQRTAEIERLQEQKESLKEQTKAAKEAVDEQTSARVEAYKAEREAELAEMQAANEQQYERLQEALELQQEARREAAAARLDEFRESLNQELDALKARNQAERDALSERLAAELEATKEANAALVDERKRANDATLAAAKEANAAQLAALKESQSEQLATLKDAQQGQLKALKESQSEQLKATKEAQQGQLDALKESQQEALDALKERQSDQLEAVKEAQSDQLKAVKDAHQAQVESMKEAQDAALKALKRGMQDQTVAAGSGGGAVAGAYDDAISEMEGDARNRSTRSTDILRGVMTGIESLTKVRGGASALRAAIGDGLSPMSDDFGRKGDESVGRLAGQLGLFTNRQMARGSAQTLASDAANGLSPLVDSARSTGDLAASGLANNLGSWQSRYSVQNAAQGLGSAAINPLSSLGPNASICGYNTSVSFANGVGSWDVQNSVRNSAQAIADSTYHPMNDVQFWTHTSGWNAGINFNNGLADASNSIMSTASGIAAGVAAYLHHSTPEKGAMRDDDKWGADMAQNLIDGMASKEGALAQQARSMAQIVRDEFNVGASASYTLGYDVRPMAQLLSAGVTEALRSGIPRHQGVTVVVQEMVVREEADVERVSERLYGLIDREERRSL